MPFKKILVAYDFSAPSERALKFAFALARRSGGQVDILHVHPGQYLGDTEPNLGLPWPTPEQSERYIRFLEQELKQLVPKDFDGRTRCLVRDGEPKQLLLAQAKELGSDLLCVGATGKGWCRKGAPRQRVA